MALLNLGAQLKGFQTGGVRQTAQLRSAINAKCFCEIN